VEETFPVTDDTPAKGTREYYCDSMYVGLVAFEDLLVQIDEIGIEHGYDVDKVLKPGNFMEETLGRRLSSEAMINGRTEKKRHVEYALLLEKYLE